MQGYNRNWSIKCQNLYWNSIKCRITSLHVEYIVSISYNEGGKNYYSLCVCLQVVSIERGGGEERGREGGKKGGWEGVR